MKYLEIKEGLSIKVEEIEAIERVDEYNCTIYTNHNLYASTFPYMTLLSIVENANEEKEKEDMQMKQNIKQLATYQQHWVG